MCDVSIGDRDERSHIIWVSFCRGYLEGNTQEMWPSKGELKVGMRVEMRFRKVKRKSIDLYFAESCLECICVSYLEGAKLQDLSTKKKETHLKIMKEIIEVIRYRLVRLKKVEADELNVSLYRAWVCLIQYFTREVYSLVKYCIFV